MTSERFVWISQSFMQILYLENVISTPRRCPETTSQTTGLVWLPNQGTFRWSGSAISYVSQSCSCAAQQKIPALNGKSNSATREPQREQTLVSFSCLEGFSHCCLIAPGFMFGTIPIITQISNFAITVQTNTSGSPLCFPSEGDHTKMGPFKTPLL